MNRQLEPAHERSALVVPSATAARLLGAMLGRDAPATWEPPDIHAWSAWVAGRFEADQLAGRAPARDVDFMLAPQQELALWQRVLADDGAPEQAAMVALEAWKLAHAWRLPWRASPAVLHSDDVNAFRRWAAVYVERCAALRATDEARFVAALPAGAVAPARALGFIDPAPAIAAAIGTAQAPLAEGSPAAFSGRAYADRAGEIAAALEWAAAVAAADDAARIVIALDSLQQDQDVVRRCLRDAFGGALSAPVELGVREALDRMPSLQSALAILELSLAPSWDASSAVVLSPHLSAAVTERAGRALFDAALRGQARFEMPLAWVVQELARATPPCPVLADMLGALLALQQGLPRRQSMIGWLAHFERCLKAVGWPGQAVTDAEAHQALAAWSQLGDRLQRLDAVLPELTLADARGRLRQALAESSAPAVAGSGPIFVVTPEDACLLAPTHLWLAGAEATALGARSRPSPFLPWPEQRAAGVPGADAARDLARGQRLISLLAAGAGARIASYCAGEDDQVFGPSPLIGALHGLSAAHGVPVLPAAWRQPAVPAASVVDECGPSLAAATITGGVAVLAAQAACPFRAFARHRLGAAAVAEPQPGLAARHKGTFVHRVLAYVWAQLHDQAALLALDDTARAELIELAIVRAERTWAHATPLERALAQVERARVTRLIEAWLAFEATRPPFSVRAVEQPASVEYAGLALNTRIDRLDRAADGHEVIVDYKTGACHESAWYPPRLDEPQLPFYALTNPSRQLAAIAFAKVDVVAPKWLEFPRAEPADAEMAWVAARDAWQADLARLAADILAGDARLSPKRGQATCRLCDMQLLCRVAESVDLADGEAIDGGDDE